MNLSLDANVLVELVNGRRPIIRQRLAEALANGDVVAACSLAAHEVLYGASISRRPEHQTSAARSVLNDLIVAEYTLEDAEVVAALRQTLRNSGRPIGPFDTLIAGQSLNRNWTMVTANTGEFARVPGLTVIDWTAEPEIT